MNNEAREIKQILEANPEIIMLNGTSVHGKYFVWRNGQKIFAEHPSELVGVASAA